MFRGCVSKKHFKSAYFSTQYTFLFKVTQVICVGGLYVETVQHLLTVM